jgi:hypothetical protein
MKIIAWNVAHQVKKRPIPDYMVEVIQDLEARATTAQRAWADLVDLDMM